MKWDFVCFYSAHSFRYQNKLYYFALTFSHVRSPCTIASNGSYLFESYSATSCARLLCNNKILGLIESGRIPCMMIRTRIYASVINFSLWDIRLSLILQRNVRPLDDVLVIDFTFCTNLATYLQVTIQQRVFHFCVLIYLYFSCYLNIVEKETFYEN